MNILKLLAIFCLFLTAGLSAAANDDVKNYGKIAVEQLLSPSPKMKKKGAEAYFKASPEQLQSMRKQFFDKTRGHFLETYVTRFDDISTVFDEHIIKKCDKAGDEKVYACSLLTYMLSPKYEKFPQITLSLLCATLAKTLKHEVASPSFVPILLDAGADPYKTCFIQKKSLRPMQIAFSRLKSRKNVGLMSDSIKLMLAHTFVDPEIVQSAHAMRAGFSVWKDTPQMDEVRKDYKGYLSDKALQGILDKMVLLQQFNAKNKNLLGRFGKTCSAKEYEECCAVWLDICVLLGADIKTLRKSVFSFLKSSRDNIFDYETDKFLRSDELDPFHKFALACVVDEFLFCVASSLHGRQVYNLNAYMLSGELEVVAREAREAHRSNAERCRRKLNPQAHKRVAYFCGDDDSDEERDEESGQVGAEASSQPSSSSC